MFRTPLNHRRSHEMRVSIVMGVAQKGWFTMENAIEMDDLGVPPFQETTKSPVSLGAPPPRSFT